MPDAERGPQEATEPELPHQLPEAGRFKPGIIFDLLMEHEGEQISPGLAGEIAAAVVQKLRRAIYAEARVLANDIASQELDLAGAAEAADILGVSRQRIHQLSKTETFPRPLTRVKATPIWFAEAIRVFDEVRSRQRGPVPQNYYDVQE